mmetsp:Transcript_8790/g.12454  ORF Transcript_8790/g.12454 Transcript_8790/m.12454 type:complete len:160 (+) Transcript_8790:170-649(+)
MRRQNPFFLLVLSVVGVLLSQCQTVNAWVQLKISPLMGGPSWLPVHVKVVVEDEHVYDFLPKNPTSPQTLQKLLSFQQVPGQIRYNGAVSSTTLSTAADNIERDGKLKSPETLSDMASKFCTSYPSNLHLVTNNCWTFALSLIWYLNTEATQQKKGQTT